MTLEQLAKLTLILENKIKEGLDTLEETSINSQTYSIVLNNLLTSTSLYNKIKVDNQPLQTEKGDA